MADVADPRCGDDPAIPNNRKNNGPVTMRVVPRPPAPADVLGDPELRAAQHNERPRTGV